MSMLTDYLNPENYSHLTKKLLAEEERTAKWWVKEYTQTISAVEGPDDLAAVAERILDGITALKQFFHTQGNQDEYIFSQGEPRNAKIKRARDMRLRYWHMLQYLEPNLHRLEQPTDKDAWVAAMIEITTEANRAENLAFRLEKLVADILDPPKVKSNPLLSD
jgi:hypothetical protein